MQTRERCKNLSYFAKEVSKTPIQGAGEVFPLREAMSVHEAVD